jgi:antitoxin YefM
MPLIAPAGSTDPVTARNRSQRVGSWSTVTEGLARDHDPWWQSTIVLGEAADLGQPRRNMAILLAMPGSEQMSLADVKNRLSEVVERLGREHGRVVITKHGRPAAVVLSVEDLESLEETLDVMDSGPLLADIRQALAELDTTGATVLTKDEALRLIAER